MATKRKPKKECELCFDQLHPGSPCEERLPYPPLRAEDYLDYSTHHPLEEVRVGDGQSKSGRIIDAELDDVSDEPPFVAKFLRRSSLSR